MRIHPLMATILGLGLVIGLAAGCTRNLKEERHTTIDARIDLLIAGDASEFKDHLRKRLITHYRSSGNIEVVNIDKLRQIDIENYHVVVIMDTCLAWSRFNPSTKAFLDRISNRDKVVVLMTVDDTDWEFKYQGVDAMTAASNLENEDQVFERLRIAIDRIVNTIPVSDFRLLYRGPEQA